METADELHISVQAILSSWVASNVKEPHTWLQVVRGDLQPPLQLIGLTIDLIPVHAFGNHRIIES